MYLSIKRTPKFEKDFIQFMLVFYVLFTKISQFIYY